MTVVRRNRDLPTGCLALRLLSAGVYLCLLLCATLGGVLPARADETSERRAAVQGQFARAEGLRQALEAKPERERSLQEYTAAAAAYRRVYLITPRAPEVPAAIKQAADLYNEMGQQFDPTYYHTALTTYEFLVHDYPTSKYLQDAELAIAALQRGPLNQPELAKKAYGDFLEEHPRSAHAAEARAALAEMARDEKQAASKPPVAPPQSTRAPAAPVAAASVPPTSRTATPAVSASAKNTSPTASSAPTASRTAAAPTAAVQPEATSSVVPSDSSSASSETGAAAPASELGQVRVWNADSYTRVIIDLGTHAKYQAARISAPDRIYFDIENAQLNARLAAQPIDIPSNGYLKSVRIAQNRADVVRVVLEVDKVKDYSVFELANPDRLVVDVYGSGTPPAAEPPATVTVVPTVVPTIRAAGDVAGPAPKVAGATKASIPSASVDKVTAAKNAKTPAVNAAPAVREAKAAAVDGRKVVRPQVAAAADTATEAKPTTETNVSEEAAQLPVLSAKKAAATMGPAPVAQPTRAGEHSLTRVLGLKVGRIVIDAGHGGHDTGTIGPTGLMEKDVCLDVSLRLGRIIQERLPLADVTYTRSDDTFVALEQRTAIANDARSDLLVSIHANSSDDHKVRGIETYYLNFNAAPAAMEVAARENALAQGGVHQLEELVQKIARNEKIEESRDLAANIQESLTRQTNSKERDRGVRRAPFVVLIGANMPSVLTEISFLSNPVDEQWLKKPENRQKIAEGIYRGIESYLKSTNSFAGNLSPAGRTVASSPDHSGQ